MDLDKVIESRRSFRSLTPVEVTQELLEEIGEKVKLAPSCYNNQPWRFVCVYEKSILKELHTTLSKGNSWAHDSSMIIAVCTKKDLDCIVKEREYFSFDTGLATAFLLLKITDLGLVAHPIAGYNEKRAKEMLGIPHDFSLICMVVVGKHNENYREIFSEEEINSEMNRPERLKLSEFFFHNRFENE
ncbi:MAG: nitroreductase family protein [bacterium]|nr:nitroreductase family protein [bacterium]